MQSDTTPETTEDPYKYIQVIVKKALVRQLPLPGAKPVLSVRQGDRLVLVWGIDSWYQVLVGDSSGWIERTQAAPWDKRTGSVILAKKSPWGMVLTVWFIVLLFGGAVVFVVKWLMERSPVVRMPVKRGRKTHVCLLIARYPKKIDSYLTGRPALLEECFVEIGFRVVRVVDPARIPADIAAAGPDAMLVDCRSRRRVAAAIQWLRSHPSQSLRSWSVSAACRRPLTVSDTCSLTRWNITVTGRSSPAAVRTGLSVRPMPGVLLTEMKSSVPRYPPTWHE